MAYSKRENNILIGSKEIKSSFPNEKNSLNPSNPLLEDGTDNSEKEYRLQRRMGRQFSINFHPSKDHKFYKVIIPYNFERKIYHINKKEIEFYENKHYLQKKLTEFNESAAFNIEKDYEPRFIQRLCLYVPAFFVAIFLFYISLIFISFFSFNPIIIYNTYSWIKKGYSSVKMFKFILFEKFKIKEIHKILNDENSSKFCTENKLKWLLGQSGYWLEVQKLIE
jgi:hypothetical protein